MPTRLNEKRVKIDSLYVYLGCISGFLMIPLLLAIFFLLIDEILSRNGIYIQMFFPLTNIAGLYVFGFIDMFAPLVVVPGVVHGFVFDKVQSRELKTQFLARDPVLQVVIVIGFPSAFMTALTFGLLLAYWFSSRFGFQTVFGSFVDFMIAFPIVVVLVSAFISLYTYVIWKKYGVVYLMERQK